jgi:uncharacterized protein YjdB
MGFSMDDSLGGKNMRWNKPGVKRLLAASLVWLLLLQLLPVGIIGSGWTHAAAPNLIANGGYDTVASPTAGWTAMKPTGWGVWLASGTPEATVDNAVYHDGSYSLRLKSLGDVISKASVNQSGLPVTAGQYYKISQWMKTDSIVSSGLGAYMRLSYQNSSGTQVGNYIFMGSLKGTNDWTLQQQILKVPTGAVTLKVEDYYDLATGTAWYDEVSLIQWIPATGIALDQTYGSLEVGESLTLAATVSPSNASDQGVIWSSSDEDVAAVANGIVTGVGSGNATITARATDGGFTASYALSVGLPPVAVTGILMPETSGTLETGGSITLTASVIPSNATNPVVSWTSSNPVVASVYGGVVQALNVGSAVITAVTEDGGFTAAYALQVVPANVLQNGSYESLNSPPAAGWTTAQPNGWGIWLAGGAPEATVDSAVYYAGQQSLRLSSLGNVSSKAVAFKGGIPVTAGQYYKVSQWVKTDSIASYGLGVYMRLSYQNSSGTQIGNYISMSSIKGTNDWTLHQQLLLIPAGATTFKFENYYDNSTGTAWFDDTRIVRWIPVTGVSLDKTMGVLHIGESLVLEAGVQPEQASNPAINWSSSNPAVASVNHGTVTGSSEGFAVITAATEEGGYTASFVVSVGNNPSVIELPDTVSTVNENGSVSGHLPAADGSGNAYIYTALDSPSNGRMKLEADGTWWYAPKEHYVGTDRFQAIVSNGKGGMGTVAVALTVSPVNDAPAIGNQIISTVKNTPVSGTLIASDGDSNTLTYGEGIAPAHGTVTVSSGGSWTYTPAPDYMGPDSFKATVTDGNGASASAEITLYVSPTGEEVVSTLKSRNLQQAHPRLMATDEDFNRIRSMVNTDSNMGRWYSQVRTTSDQILTEPVSTYELQGSEGLLWTSRKVLKRVFNLGIMHQVSGDDRYAERLWEELNAAAQFPNWGPYEHFLDTGEMTAAFALGYDWLYNYWTPERRTVLRDAIVEKGLNAALPIYNQSNYFTQNINNWNAVCNGGIGLGALAVGDESPEIEAKAKVILEGGLKSLPRMLAQYAPNGGWFEGPVYWDYATSYLVYYLSSLENAVGTDYGLSDFPGVAQSPDFPIASTGSTGTFNFADAAPDFVRSPTLLWFAGKYNKPEYAWYHKSMNSSSPLDLIWYRADLYDTAADAGGLDRYFGNIEVADMHNTLEGVFAGFKAGDNQAPHGNLDIGTFVMDALGVRWAMDLGADKYSLPGYFSMGVNGERWNYYRTRPEGQNTLVINPDKSPGQSRLAMARMETFEASQESSYAIADLTPAYSADASSVRRGVKLQNHRKELLVQDEMKLKLPSEVYWFMHTKARVDIAPDGRSAVLTQGDKRLFAEILTAPGAVFSVMDAVPLPDSPQPAGQDANTGIRKLTIRMEHVTEETLAVRLVPLMPPEPLPSDVPVTVPLDHWANAELPPATLSGIQIDGLPLASFNERKLVYEVKLPYGTKAIPQVTAQAVNSGDPVTIAQAGALPGSAVIHIGSESNSGKDPSVYYVDFTILPMIGMPEGQPELTVAGVIASETDAANVAAHTLDGNPETRWSAAGNPWIQFDLGEVQTVGGVGLSWFKGDVRNTYFDIQLSLDGTVWTQVFTGKSSGITNELEVYGFTDTDARFIRIVGHGNTQNNFTSVTEAAVFGALELPAEAELAALTGNSQVDAGEHYTLTYGVIGAQAISAQDLMIIYDSQVFELTGAAPLAADTVIAHTYANSPGTVRYILATTGEGDALNGDVPVLELTFLAKAVTDSTTFTIAHAVLADGNGNEWRNAAVQKTVRVAVKTDLSALQSAVQEAQSLYDGAVEGFADGHYILGSKVNLLTALNAAQAVLDHADAAQAELDQAAAELKQASDHFLTRMITDTTGDVTGAGGQPDGRITVADLGYVAARYGKTSADAQWSTVQTADIDKNGLIDFYDLTFVARRLIESGR